jgi:hypothetical protein
MGKNTYYLIIWHLDNENRFVQDILLVLLDSLTSQLQNEHQEIFWYRVKFLKKKLIHNMPNNVQIGNLRVNGKMNLLHVGTSLLIQITQVVKIFQMVI